MPEPGIGGREEGSFGGTGQRDAGRPDRDGNGRNRDEGVGFTRNVLASTVQPDVMISPIINPSISGDSGRTPQDTTPSIWPMLIIIGVAVLILLEGK